MPSWLFSRGRRKQSMQDEKKDIPGQSPVLKADAGALGRRRSRKKNRRKRRSSSLDGPTQKERDVSPPSPVDISTEKHPYSHPHGSAEDITALPLSPVLGHSPHLRPIARDNAHIPYNFSLHADSNPGLRSSGSLPMGMMAQHSDKENIPPGRERGRLRKSQTGPAKSNYGSQPTRRKSSRRKRDPVREEEIRAMSAPLSIKRPATFSGGLLRRDSKKARQGIGRHLDGPTSDVSLPTEESLRSSLSGTSEQRPYVVSGLAVFTARPTIRYSANGPYPSYTVSAPIWGHLKTGGPKDKQLTERDEANERRRFGDLAEDMDAGSIREIMERDRKRKEKKKKQDEQRLRQKLERKLEKQRAKEEKKEPETGTLERRRPGLMGLGIAPPHPSTRPVHPLEREAAEAAAAAAAATQEAKDTSKEDSRPSTAQSGVAGTPLQTPTEEPIVDSAQAIRFSRPPQRASTASANPAHTRMSSDTSNVAALMSELVPPPRVNENPLPQRRSSRFDSNRYERRSSEQSNSKRGGIWSAIFRRGSSSKRSSIDQGKTTPSEVSFSNTSRESMSRQPLPAHLVQQPPPPPPPPSAFTRRASGTPARTRSKFKEDLPEVARSPPGSRVQSQEIPTPPQTLTERRGKIAPSNIDTNPEDMGDESKSGSSAGRVDSPDTPSHPPRNASAMSQISQSLASVDSEGSWLSGKPIKRRSNMRGSISSQPTRDDFTGSYEELGIPDDEYFQRLTPQGDDHRQSSLSGAANRRASSTAMGGVATDEVDPELLHGGAARRPHLIQTGGHAKSHQGQVHQSDDDDRTPTSPDRDTGSALGTPIDEPEPEIKVQRATSIDLGSHHARQLSAGSARLLDIPAKRSSRGPTSAPAPVPADESTIDESIAFL